MREDSTSFLVSLIALLNRGIFPAFRLSEKQLLRLYEANWLKHCNHTTGSHHISVLLLNLNFACPYWFRFLSRVSQATYSAMESFINNILNINLKCDNTSKDKQENNIIK